MESKEQQEGPKAEVITLNPPRILTAEERNDLRQRVLRGEKMTLEEARDVYFTIRQGQGAAIINGEAAPKKTRKKKEAYSDAELQADFEKFGI